MRTSLIALTAAVAVLAGALSGAASAQGLNGPKVKAGSLRSPIGSLLGAAQMYAVVNPDGSVQRGAGVNTGLTQKLATGTYEVIFRRNITGCAFVGGGGIAAFSGTEPPTLVQLAGRAGNNSGVFVQTLDLASHAAVDRSFHLMVICG